MSYCTKNEVNSLFGDISDDISDDLFNTVIDNSTAWVDSNLRKANVPLPEIEEESVEEIVEPETSEEATETTTTTEEVEETVASEETETVTEEEETETTSTTEATSQTTTTVTYNLINVPSGLRTAAIYYAASDILLSLYHGEEMPVQYDVWYQKATQLLNDYIDSYLNENADSSDAVEHQMVKHSHGLTYNQKRRRGRFY